MIKNPTFPTLDDAQGIDALLSQVNTKLTAELSWLDLALGRAEVRREQANGRTLTFPAAYVSDENYVKLLPDGHLGSFSYFELLDPIDILWENNVRGKYRGTFGLVVWWDWRDYHANHETRTIENVKLDLLAVLRKQYTGGRLIPQRFFERVESIYKGYSIEQINDIYLMRPYGALRIEGQVIYTEVCP